MPAGIHGGHKQPLSPQHHIEHHDENSTRSLATQIAFVLGIAVLLCGLCIVMGSYIKRVDISRATLYSILLHCVYGFSGVALTLGQVCAVESRGFNACAPQIRGARSNPSYPLGATACRRSNRWLEGDSFSHKLACWCCLPTLGPRLHSRCGRAWRLTDR
eukprot:SAG11_NODE_1216_length_5501_cov_2.800629_2_plen_160_part_00